MNAVQFESYVFLKLASFSQQRQQYRQRDEFLILSADGLTRAGLESLSERCHQLVVKHQPHHFLANSPTWRAARQSEEYGPFRRQLVKLCSVERGELILSEWGVELDLVRDLGNEATAALLDRLVNQLESGSVS